MLARRAERGAPASSVELHAKLGGMHIEPTHQLTPGLELHSLPAELLLLIADAVIPPAARHGTWRPVTNLPARLRSTSGEVGGCLDAWEQKVGKQPLADLFRDWYFPPGSPIGRLGCVRDGLPA